MSGLARSRAEIEAISVKAAIGAGLSLGLAEDYGRAAGVLAMTDPDALGTVAQALSPPASTATQMPGVIDALRCGASIDLPTAHPALVRAYLLRAALDQPGDFPGITQADLQAARLTRAVAVPDVVWSELSALAARTYVPETEGSRLSGAGAGLTDND